MCDYCDCRRIPEIARLAEDHERIQVVADAALQLARSGGTGLEEALVELREALAPHVEREEAGVFTQARVSGLTSYLDDLEDDHRRFARLLDHPRGFDSAALESLIDELHRHIAIEEYDLFPAASQVFREDQWLDMVAL